MQRLNEYFLTLDIETSSEYEKDKNGNEKPIAVWLSYGYSIFWDKCGNPIEVCYFRDWLTLKNFYDKISSKYYYYEIINYVHNLGYEFDFLIKNVSKPIKFLSNSTHATISGTLERYKNIQFRCSYLLSGYSLKKLGDIVGLPKLESDYRTIYPDDEVTEEEKFYCYRDNEIVAQYIVKVLLKEYGTVHNIPYTKTGRVRRMFQSNYIKGDWDIMPTEECYRALEKAFNGGITISNPRFTNMDLRKVHSYDIVSSYPFATLSEKFPQKIRRCMCPRKLDYRNYFIAKIRMKNINSIYDWQWLSISKMENIADGSIFFNGKLMYSPSVDRYVTNVDFEIISKTYEFEYEVLEYYELYQVEDLPECFINTILYYADKKHKLKQERKCYKEGTEEFFEIDREYTLSKNDFNSIYGMMVEKLVKPIYYIDEDFIWHKKDGEYKYSEEKHLKRNFIFGVYITAYARRNLINAILTNCPHTFVYADTDSIKFIGENNFIDTNKQIHEYLREYECVKQLGRFEYEGTYEQFKTLGAKKYCYSNDNKHFVCTVAGLPKNDYGFASLDEFHCGKIFKNCKLGKRYIVNEKAIEIDDEGTVIECCIDEKVQDFLDENKINTAGGIGLFPTSYSLDMTRNDKRICNDYLEGLNRWLKLYEQQNGIDLTEFCHINASIT